MSRIRIHPTATPRTGAGSRAPRAEHGLASRPQRALRGPGLRARRALRAALWAAGAGLCAGSAFGQSIDRGGQTAWAQVGAFRADIDSVIRVDYRGSDTLGIDPIGTTLDAEDNLGLDRSRTVANVSLGFRLSERWRVELESYRIERVARRQLNESVVIDGVTFAASAELESSFRSRVERLSLGYSLHKAPTSEAGLLLGVQYTRYRLAFTGQGRYNDEPPVSRSAAQSDEGPLPTVGFFGTAGLPAGWSVAGRADFLPVHTRRVRGSVINYEANAYYALTRNVAAGVGYRVGEYKVTRKDTGDLGARFEYKFKGPQLLLEAGF
jgi:hypothetical protein